jgi:predicted dehydrogenase
MEMWHPNPSFFFLPGAGPVLDVGPYYVANLINLIGPVRRVAALTNSATPTRRVTAEGPLKGQEIPVKTPTTIHALLEFASGAAVTLGASWDVWGHGHRPMELYGTDGAIVVPDPNWFGGTVELVGSDGRAREVPMWDHPFAKPNDVRPSGAYANYRTAGLADMALSIIEGREARCGLERALHGIDVMTSILRSGETGAFVDLTTTCTRPEPLGPEAARALLA